MKFFGFAFDVLHNDGHLFRTAVTNTAICVAFPFRALAFPARVVASFRYALARMASFGRRKRFIGSDREDFRGDNGRRYFVTVGGDCC